MKRRNAETQKRRNTLLLLGLLIATPAIGQTPAVRVIGEGAAVGAFTSAGENEWSQIRHGDGTYTLAVAPLRTASRVQVIVAQSSTAGFYLEHLGMRVDLLKAPSPVPMPGGYPGLLQGPLVAGSSDAGSVLLGSLDLSRPVRVSVSTGGVGLDFVGPFAAGQAVTLRYFCAGDAGEGGERGQIIRLGKAYAKALTPGFTAPDVLRRTHGLLAFMGQDRARPRQDFARAWAESTALAGAIWWGPSADLGGSCCAAKPAWHPRYGDVPALVAQLHGVLAGNESWAVWAYARPDPAEDGRPDSGFLQSWVAEHRRQGLRTYLDTAGFRVLDPAAVPEDAIIEGASLAYPCAALVSNAMSGGAFAFGGGGLPLTLPDGTPEPRSTKGWLTSFPPLGKGIQSERVMLIGDQNTDGYFAGTYIAGDGRRFSDELWRFALSYDLLLCPRTMTPGVAAVMAARDAVGWLDQDRDWLDVGRWRDRHTGKVWRVDGMRIVEAGP